LWRIQKERNEHFARTQTPDTAIPVLVLHFRTIPCLRDYCYRRPNLPFDYGKFKLGQYPFLFRLAQAARICDNSAAGASE
jgi:hypothetical protein